MKNWKKKNILVYKKKRKISWGRTSLINMKKRKISWGRTELVNSASKLQ